VKRREQYQVGPGQVADDRLGAAGDRNRNVAVEHALNQDTAALDVEHLGVEAVLFEKAHVAGDPDDRVVGADSRVGDVYIFAPQPRRDHQRGRCEY
jgi:hypothetical protein